MDVALCPAAAEHSRKREGPEMPRPATFTDWLSLLALSVLWGSSFAVNEVALQAFSPAMLVAGRIFIAAVVLYIFMRASGVRLPSSLSGWKPMLVMAVFGNLVPFQLVAWAQLHLDSSVAGVLMAVMPLFVLTLAHFFLPYSQLTPFRIAGFLLGFAGVVFVIGPATFVTLDGNMALWGSLAVLAAAFSYSINSVYARRLGATDPVQLSAGMLLTTSVLCLPQAAIGLPALGVPSMSAVVALLALGLLSTGFATIIYFRVVQGPGPTFLSLVSYLVPACAVIVGSVFLGESLDAYAYFGLALILGGIAVSELGPRKGPFQFPSLAGAKTLT
jgi:drug/metabolite transporter (DMT)-like permease